MVSCYMKKYDNFQVICRYRYVKDCIAKKLPLNEKIMKDIHAILMNNIFVGGVYRNVEVYTSGAQHTPPAPNEMYRQIKNRLEYFNTLEVYAVEGNIVSGK